MRVATVADIHIGNHRLFGGPMVGGLNARARVTIACLEAALTSAYGDGATKIVIAGDLFDTDLPNPAMMRAVQYAIGMVPIPVIVLNGNHDMTSMDPWHTAVAPLAACPNADVVTIPTYRFDVGSGILMVPHRPGPAKDWLEDDVSSVVGQSDHRCTLLVVHLGIEHKDTPPWLRGSDDSIHEDQLRYICQKNGIKTVHAGNWHGVWSSTKAGIHLRQVSALVPTGFDNPGLDAYGRIAWWDDVEGPLPDTIIHGPRFTKVKSVSELQTFNDHVRPATEDLHYVHAQIPQHEWWGAKMILDKLVEDKFVEAFKTSKQPSEVREAAASAAQSAADASTLGESLFDYIAESDLPDGADLGRVHQTCRRLLKLEAENA